MPLSLECPASAVEEQATVSANNDTNSAIVFIMCIFIESGIAGYLGAVHFFYIGGILSSTRSFCNHGVAKSKKTFCQKNTMRPGLEIFFLISLCDHLSDHYQKVLEVCHSERQATVLLYIVTCSLSGKGGRRNS